MKRILYMMLIFTVFMAGIFVAAFMRRGEVLEKRDMSFYNDRIYKIEQEYLAGTGTDELEQRYDCRIILKDEGVNLTPELNALYASRALVLDLAPEGRVIGKVAWDEAQQQIKKAEKGILKKGFVVWLLVLLAGYGLLLVVYVKILRPEQAMERFAGEIAKGNLDIPLPIERDNMFGNLTNSFDIMREEMKSARDREIAADKAKKEMQLSLAHDIGTPVATIRTACEMIELLAGEADKETGFFGQCPQNDSRNEPVILRSEATKDPENLVKILEKVRIIDSKAETISRLTDNIFHASLAESEHVPVHVGEESSELIEEYFRRLTGYGNIILENKIRPCLVYMDKLRMEQVVDNIVGNSHKYAGTDIRVRFDEAEAGRENDKQRYIRITVRDSGPGVPEEDLPLIAEKYYRGSDTGGKPGAGLGMYLASYYMEKQGGGMEFYNDNGFVVELLVKVV